MSNKIRNVGQTAQEREIVKTAPDIVVYLEGLPYLVNPYIAGPNNKDYTIVNFNDYVTAFNATYDVDNLKPSCSLTISVPNHQKSLYQAPGGNNLIESMMELQVFAKNYFPAASGNTVYSRVFKGVVSHVVHNDDGKTLSITVQGQGILRFFELMQIELNPALLTNADRSAQVLTNNQSNLDPYEQIADTFLRGITFESFQQNALLQTRVKDSDFAQSVKAGYANKWQQILMSIRNDVHIFGYTFGSVLPLDINGISGPNPQRGKIDPRYFQISDDTVGLKKESDGTRDLYVDILKGYLPDFKIGTIQLLNGNIIPRLERIRQIVSAIGMEAFQDINGEIIVKPPLYNLDVKDTTPITISSSTQNGAKAEDANRKFNQNNNPFIVHLSEIKTEQETEDEQGIRATRVTIQGDWAKNFHFDLPSSLRTTVWHIDIPKLTQFGLREEPPRTLTWLTADDKIQMYTYAVSELNRANRAFRTYNVTIPMRPELRLGFPMYFPHRDMYGYIRSVSLNYQMGGDATMSIMLDTLRKRPVFPVSHQLKEVDSNTGRPKEVTIFTTQPNLVMKWTTPPGQLPTNSARTASILSAFATTNPEISSTQGATQNDSSTATAGKVDAAKQGAAGTGDVATSDPSVNFVGNAATQTQNKQAPVWDEQLKIDHFRREQLGTYWGTKADTVSKSFRVQKDVDSDVSPGKAFFSRERWITPRQAKDAKGNPIFVTQVTGSIPFSNELEGLGPDAGGVDQVPKMTSGIDNVYMQRILWEQPFTDEEGYELITPFPWGRWKTLPEAYAETRQGNIVEYANPQDLQVLNGVSTFLFAGMASPTSVESGSVLQTALSALRDQVQSKDSFELASGTPDKTVDESKILSTTQPENTVSSDVYLNNQTEEQLQQKLNLFITGGAAPDPQTQSLLDLAQNNKTVGVTKTPPKSKK